MVTTLALTCLVLGDDVDLIFEVEIPESKKVMNLKDSIKEKNQNAFAHVDAKTLNLWKVSISTTAADSNEKIQQLNLLEEQRLRSADELGAIFSDQIALNHIHIIVKPPPSTTDEPPYKRLRLDTESPHTPPAKGKTNAKHSPKRLNNKEIATAMEEAIKPFEQYIDDLANGKLDGHLSFIRPEEKEPILGVNVPPRPILLLHDLGEKLNQADEKRIDDLFRPGVTHLFAVSGSGKTRLSLEGLCKHWGMYFSCSVKLRWATGSGDIQEATNAFESMTATEELPETPSPVDKENNIKAANRAFLQLLCARSFILKKLLYKIPPGTHAPLARRRWVLAQILPPYAEYDIFVTVLMAIRGGLADALRAVISATLNELATAKHDLFPSSTGLYAVVDEAQTAVKDPGRYFLSSDGTTSRPLLREIVRSLNYSGTFNGVILSGTGLSLDMVNKALSSASAKGKDKPRVFVDTGRFAVDDPSQVTYIKRYIAPDTRLLERIKYWLSGRHRFTASVIEILLSENNISPHRALTRFVELTTGFTLSDATDLEALEPPLPADVINDVDYEKISSENLFTQKDDDGLIQELLRIVMTWIVGSKPSLSIEGKMREVIAVGVGFLKQSPVNTYPPDDNYPVYIDEPLVVLDLCRRFQQHGATTRKRWIQKAFLDASTRSSLGFAFEEVVLFVLMETFGGEARRLDEVFNCKSDQDWISRKVKLVSLKGTLDGDLRACDVSWTTGSSDRLGLKAGSPEDVLNFLCDPDGKAFLFPDNHMGPDLLCFLQDEETGRLITVLVQAKIAEKLDTTTWRSAVGSTDPNHFYTFRKTEDGKLRQYAPISKPTLRDDISHALEEILGEQEYAHVLEGYRAKLCSSKKATNPPVGRETPRFLRVIATPDDEQHCKLKAQLEGNVVVLQWQQVKSYLGDAAAAATTTIKPVQ